MHCFFWKKALAPSVRSSITKTTVVTIKSGDRNLQRADDFTFSVKQILAQRTGFRCSNPKCRKPTAGPAVSNPSASVNIGVAAHITSASPGGARYDETLSSTDRRASENGIWCCQNCGKLIDSDAQGYPVELLYEWKALAEKTALNAIESSNPSGEKSVGPEVGQAMQNIMLGALEGHGENFIVVQEGNGRMQVVLCGDVYRSDETQRLLYLEANKQLTADGLVQHRAGPIHELTLDGLTEAKKLHAQGLRRQKP
jgi:hypothetical protein